MAVVIQQEGGLIRIYSKRTDILLLLLLLLLYRTGNKLKDGDND